MKKKNVINLIKYYVKKNDDGFRSVAFEIAKDFARDGDYMLSDYIILLLAGANTFVPQIPEDDSKPKIIQSYVEEKEKLLPCPFCGGKAKLVSSVESWVECKSCGATSRFCACDSGAIEKWNKRV